MLFSLKEFMKSINKNDYMWAALLFTLVLLIFNGYLTGQVAPSWDFYGDYYTQAYAWWNLGDFFKPTTFLPYLMSGFPAHLGLQVSSFYLPVGFVAELFGYTIVNAARLQAITIGFGIVGVYFLSRKINFAIAPSFIISLGYFFSAGFFSNATHVDIVRAWAFLPWLLLISLPLTKINWYLLPLTSLLWFQFFVGAYPGNIVSTFYIFIFWFILLYFFYKNLVAKTFLFVGTSVACGLMLASLKWLPFLISGNGPNIPNQVVVDKGILSTLFFPYSGSALPGDSILPNDITQRTFFIIPLLVILAFFANKSKFQIVFGIGLLFIGLILGIDTPIFNKWQETLPLLDISRFRTIDFKPLISLGISILAGAGFSYLIKIKPKDFFAIENFIRLMSSSVFILFIYVLGRKSQISYQDIQTGSFWILLSILSFATFIIFCFFNFQKLGIFVILFSTFLLGNLWINQFMLPWQTPRIPTENAYFGTSSAEALKNQQPILLEFRPERSGPEFPIPYDAGLVFQRYNVWELRREYSMGGYVNIKGEKLFKDYVKGAQIERNVAIYEFLRQKSSVKFSIDDSVNDLCISNSTCEDKEIFGKVIKYGPGLIEIEVGNIKSNTKMYLNELNWNGWNLYTCTDTEICSKISKSDEKSGILLNFAIPEKTKYLKTIYQTPFINLAWLLFSFAVIINIILVANKFWKSFKN